MCWEPCSTAINLAITSTEGEIVAEKEVLRTEIDKMITEIEV